MSEENTMTHKEKFDGTWGINREWHIPNKVHNLMMFKEKPGPFDDLFITSPFFDVANIINYATS